MLTVATNAELLRSTARGGEADYHLRAAVQLDISLGSEQDAGDFSHPWILLPRCIVCQQHAGDCGGPNGYVAVLGYNGSCHRATVSSGSYAGMCGGRCAGLGGGSLRRAVCS